MMKVWSYLSSAFCGLEHSMFTVPRYSVASFYTSAALQVWSRYPELFQSVYPTIPPATCALASFWLSQSDPSNHAQGGVCGSGGNRTLAHPYCYIPVAPADSGRTLQSALSAYRLSLPSLWEWVESNHRSGQILRCWLLQFTSLSLPTNVFNPRLLEVVWTVLDASISGLSCGIRRRP